MVSNSKGMSLVEVLVAGSIAVGVFFYINRAIVDVQKFQIKSEKRIEMGLMKTKIRSLLADVRAWKDNPEGLVLNQNETPLYWVKSENLHPLSLSEEEYGKRAQLKNFRCFEEKSRCRIILFNSNGQVIPKGTMVPKAHFRAQVILLTPDDFISQSYVPEYKIQLEDVGSAIKARPTIFYANQVRENDLPNVIARGECYLKFKKRYGQYEKDGFEICQQGNGLAPFECYHSLRERSFEHILSKVVCFGARNLRPLECFEEAQKIPLPKNQAAILCSRASGLSPIDCFEEVKESFRGQARDLLVKVCSRAENVSPGICLKNLMKSNNTPEEYALFLCPHHK